MQAYGGHADLLNRLRYHVLQTRFWRSRTAIKLLEFPRPLRIVWRVVPVPEVVLAAFIAVVEPVSGLRPASRGDWLVVLHEEGRRVDAGGVVVLVYYAVVELG
jgi:hypothetical protein